VSVENELMML